MCEKAGLFGVLTLTIQEKCGSIVTLKQGRSERNVL